MRLRVHAFNCIVVAAALWVLGGVCPAHAHSDTKCASIMADSYTRVESQRGLFKKWPFYKHVQALSDFSKSVAAKAFPNAAEDEEVAEQFPQLTLQALKDPQFKLSDAEAQFLLRHSGYKKAFAGVMATAEIFRLNAKLFIKLMKYWEGQASIVHMGHRQNWRQEGIAILKSIYNGPIRFATSLFLPRMAGPTDEIFKKQWQSPDGFYEPTEEEWQRLERFDGDTRFLDKSKFSLERERWFQFRKLAGMAGFGLYALGQAMLINFGLQNIQNGEFVTVDDFLTQAEYRLEPNEVRLYNETVPFPHLAIEIDGKVYSYGQTHMTVRTDDEYLRSGEIAEMLAKDDNNTPEGSWNWTIDKLGQGVKSVLKHAGPRSVQMVTVHLTEASYDELRRNLEMSSAMRYRNITFAMDCATMIHNALKKSLKVEAGNDDVLQVPKFFPIDASPGWTVQYFALLQTLGLKNLDGLPIVDGLQQVTSGTAAEAGRESILWRNLLINNLENSVVVNMLPVALPQRVYLHFRYGEEGFQFWDPATYDVMAHIGSDSLSELREKENNLRLDQFRAGIRALLALDANDASVQARWQKLWSDVELYFADLIAQEQSRLTSPTTSFNELLRAGFRVEYLKTLQAQLRGSQYQREPVFVPRLQLEKVLKQLTRLSVQSSLSSSEQLPLASSSPK